MRRSSLALSLLLGLISVIVITQRVSFTEANPFPTDPVISIESPVNKTYSVTSLALNVAVVTKYDGWYFTGAKTLVYSIDGKANVSITETNYSYDEEQHESTFNGSALLSELTDGPHNLVVYTAYDYGTRIFEAQSTTFFTINLPAPNAAPNPDSLTWIMPVVVIAVVAGIGLLVYFKKRKH